MGGILSSGPYEHNPLVGNRPMKFPYTLSAQIAQFPIVYYWRYTPYTKSFTLALIPCIYIMYRIQKATKTPANIKEWEERRKQWYTRHLPGEWEYY